MGFTFFLSPFCLSKSRLPTKTFLFVWFCQMPQCLNVFLAFLLSTYYLLFQIKHSISPFLVECVFFYELFRSDVEIYVYIFILKTIFLLQIQFRLDHGIPTMEKSCPLYLIQGILYHDRMTRLHQGHLPHISARFTWRTCFSAFNSLSRETPTAKEK